MGTISDFLENELLDHICNAAYTPPTTVYLGLSTADPTDDASGLTEPGDTYARQAITFGAAASRRVTQSGAITFPQATASWGTITHWALFDASAAGNMMAHGALSESKEVVSGNTPSVADTEVYVEFTAGEVSDYLANALLDFAFRNQAFAQPDTYVALVTATVADDDTGSTITEPGDTYARVQVNPNGGASPTWDLAASSLVDNTHLIQFATPTASWGTIVGVAIVDAAAAGNLLLYDNALADQAVGTDDDVNFPAGDLDLTLD